MANYGQLGIGVTAETRDMERQISAAATRAGKEAGQNVANSMGDSLKKVTGPIASGVSAIGGAIGKVSGVTANVLGGATIAAGAFGVAAIKTAMRAGEMDAALTAIAKSTGVSKKSMDEQVKTVREQGVTLGVAQNLVAQFARSNLDVAKATDLARVAQDLAILTQQDSSQTLNDLLYAIQTGNTNLDAFRQLNINATSAQDAFAASVGKSRKDLTQAEKQQALLNAVIKAGVPIAGTYKAAMEEPGKVLRSFPRLFDDIRQSVGGVFMDSMKSVIGSKGKGLYGLVGAIKDAVGEGGSFRPILEAMGQAATRLVQPMADVVGKLTEWVKKVPPGAFDGIVKAIEKFAPLIASAGTGLATFAGGNIMSKIPVLSGLLGNLGGPLGAVAVAIGTLVATSPDMRSAFGQIVDVAKGLLPTIKDLAATFLSSLMPVLKDLAPILVDLAKQVSGILGEAIKSLIPLLPPLGKALQGVIKFMAPLVTVVGELLKWLLKGPLGTVIIALAAAIWILNAALSANPIVLIIIAIVVALAGLVFAVKLIIDNFDKIKAAVVGAFDAVKNAVMTAVNWVIDFVKNNWPYILIAFMGPVGLVIAGVIKFKDQIIGFFTAIPGAIWSALQALPGLLGDLFIKAIQGVIFLIAVQVLLVYKAFTDWIPGILKALANLAVSLATTFKNAIIALPGVLASAATAMFKWFTDLPGNIIRLISSLGSLLATTGRNALAAMASAISSAASALWTFFSQLPGRVLGYLGRLAGDLGAKGGEALRAMVNGITTAAHALWDFFSGLPGKIAGFVTGLPGQLYNIGRDMIQGLINGIGSLAGAVTEKIKSVVSSPIDAAKKLLKIGSPSKVFADMGKDTVLGYIQGIESMAGQVAPAVATAIPTSVGDMTGGMAGAPVAAGGPAVLIQQADFHDEADIDAFMRQTSWAVRTGRI